MAKAKSAEALWKALEPAGTSSGIPMKVEVRPPVALVNASWWSKQEEPELVDVDDFDDGEEEEEEMTITALVRQNPVPTSAAAVAGLSGAGFIAWRIMQRRKLLKDLQANPPFSLLALKDQKEIVSAYLPIASVKTATKAREEIFGHPETWTEMLSRYVPGVTEARETAAGVRTAVSDAAETAQKTAQSWADWAWQRSPFAGALAGPYGDAYGSAMVPIPGVGLILTVAAAGLMWHRSKASSTPARVGKTAAIVILPFAPQAYLGYLGYQYIKNKV